mgnify:CR=1 FL=1
MPGATDDQRHDGRAGPLGSGKTRLAQRLADDVPAGHLQGTQHAHEREVRVLGKAGRINPAPHLFDVVGILAAQVPVFILQGNLYGVDLFRPSVEIAQLAQQADFPAGVVNVVSGTGKKPWKQKGTGRARQGSTRAPQFVGGGVVHGPHPRDYSQRTPKKMKAAALRGALSDRAREGRIHVVETLAAAVGALLPEHAVVVDEGNTAGHL